MNTIELLEHEELITESGNKELVLTTHRIRHYSSDTHITSIMIEKISSVEVNYQSWIILLLLGLGFACFGMVAGYNNTPGMMLPGFVIGLFFIIAYFITRTHVVTISSGGGAKIIFATKGMNTETLLAFIHKIEQAKSNRLK